MLGGGGSPTAGTPPFDLWYCPYSYYIALMVDHRCSIDCGKFQAEGSIKFVKFPTVDDACDSFRLV